MAGLTDLIQDMIKSNEATTLELKNTQESFKKLEAKVDSQTSDTHIIDLMQEEFYKSEYFSSKEFYNDVGQALVDRHGLGNLVEFDNEQLHKAIYDYLAENLDSEGIVKNLVNDYNEEIRDAMIRRIRLESKSIIDNYDFSYQVVPRIEGLFREFMKNYELTNYLMRSTAQLFVAQENNLNFMLEYIVTKNFFDKG